MISEYPIVIFSFTLPENRNTSCNTIAIFFLKSSGTICLRSVPSSKIAPSSGSYRPEATLKIVLLPDPILPRIPTFSPAFTVKETLSRILELCPGYLKLTFLNSRLPSIFGRRRKSLPSTSSLGSCISLSNAAYAVLAWL